MSPKKLQIRYYGHPDLRTKAKPVEKITPKILEICQSMIDTMVSMSNCIGFAGPQLGILLRIFVIREEKSLPDGTSYFAEPEVIINPILSSPSKEQESLVEGCMSLPGFQAEIFRPISIHVRYQNRKGEVVEEALSGFRARMFMHENDHLNGVLIIDRMDPREKKKADSILRKLKTQK